MTDSSLEPPPRMVVLIASLLAILAAARLLFAFVPSMEAWGINLLRFTSSPWAWTLAVLSALALIPPLARRAAPVLARFGAPSIWNAIAWPLAAAIAVLLLPDRSLFVGDVHLRTSSSQTLVSGLSGLYPQGLPLDALLHDQLPRAAASVTPIGIPGWWRILGAIEAALLAMLAVRMARSLGLQGGATVATVATVAAGGYLTLFTGYNKAFAELTLVVIAVAVFGLEVARGRTRLLHLSMAVAAGILLHRLGIALLPAWAAALVISWRGDRDPGAKQRSEAKTWDSMLAALLPVIALAVVLPRLISAGFMVDAGNFLPEQARRAGVLQAAFAGPHLLDLGNALLFLAPLAPLALAAPWVALRPGRRPEALVLGALTLPLLIYLPFFHPPQGLFRDWDALAPSAAALTVVAAWVVGMVLDGRVPVETGGGRNAGGSGAKGTPRERDRARGAASSAHAHHPRAWLAAGVVLGALAPVTQSLLLHSDPGAGFERLRSFIQEPPPRSDSERATVWDFLGARHLELGMADSASAAFERAAQLTPSPRILREWAASEMVRGNPERALEILRQLLARKPDDISALMEYAILSQRTGDHDEALRAAEQAVRVAPEEPRARALLESLSSPPSP